MNKRMAKSLRWLAIMGAYTCLFFISMLLSMGLLIKGEETTTPDFIGKNIQEGRQIALKSKLHLKESVGDYGPAYPPHTVVNQSPAAETSIKENSTVMVFVSAAVAQVEMPDIIGQNVRNAEKILHEKKLKRGHVSYISVRDVAIDTIVAQSFTPGSRISENRDVDLLVSRGAEQSSYIMPDLIGQDAAKVVAFFESRGLKISSIQEKSYYGLRPGIILKQSPDPGFEINTWNKIGIQVSK